MEHFEIKVKGKVQRAGYRDIVQEAAIDLGFTGYVENMPDLSVRIVCEGPEEKIEEFLNRINVKNRLIDVKAIDVKKTEQEEHFEIFEIKRGDVSAELGERLDTAIVLFKDMNERMDRGFTEVKDAVAEVKDEVHEVKNEVHEVKKAVFEVKEEVHDVKEEVHEVKKAVFEVKDGVEEVKEEVSGMKEDMRKGFSGLKREITDMHIGMNENFNRLDGKYHTISDELTRIRKAIIKGLNINEEEIESEESQSS